MNAERLLAYYSEIAEAPDAAARLRQFILGLAVRGKLVPQDPNDEPASELLTRIANEKNEAGRGASRGRRLQSRPRTGEFDFSAPIGWAVSTLGEVALKLTDGAHQTPTYLPSGIPFVSVKDFSGGRLDLSNTRFISPDEHRDLYRRCDPGRGDILFGRIGTLGKAVLVDTDIEFSLFVSVGLIKYSQDHINPNYFRLLLNSPLIEAEFEKIKIGGGTHTNKLNLGDLQTVAVPLPPLAEQRRIVAKVDELMALCDELEAARTAREAARDRLAAASLARLNTPAPETFQADARFALDALPALTARPHQIKQLRQTVLNLAVQGKLVPQDPAEEPAAIQLQRVAAERLGAGGFKKLRTGKVDKAIATSTDELPSSWSFTTLGDLALAMRYGTSIKCERNIAGVPVLRIPNVSAGTVTLDDIKFGPLTPAEATELGVEAGDLLLIRSNGSLDIVGRCAVVPPQAEGMSFAGYLVRLRLSKTSTSPAYVKLALSSTGVRDQIERPIRSAVGLKNVNLAEFSSLRFRLPPLAEQHRIVAKVDELMTLCDELEASLATAEATRQRLLDGLLADALTDQELSSQAA